MYSFLKTSWPKYLIPVLTMLIYVHPAQAAKVEVLVRGVIADTTCSVITQFSGGGNSVDLGNVGAAVLSSSNSAWVWNTFNIGLEHCPTTISKARMTISGVPDDDNPLYFKNIATAGEGSQGIAKNVAVEIMPQIGYDILSNGSQINTTVNGKTHTGEFALQARMIAPAGRATPGKVMGHIDFVIEYQ